MKPSILVAILFLLSSVFVSAQQWDGSPNQFNNVYRYGDISVHYNSSSRTTIGAAWGGADIGYGTGYLGFNLSRNNHSNGLWQYQSDGAANGGGVIYSTIFGDMLFSVKTSTGSSSGNVTDFDIKNNIRMRLNRDGKLIIGNVFDYGQDVAWPGTYRLYVQDGILTEKVKVALKTTGDWADYVFDKGYKLRPLAELDDFIKTNRHLPGIPTTSEVLKNGLDLSGMMAKFLEKIEELTLYVLQIEKDKQVLQQQVNELAKKNPVAETKKEESTSLSALQQQIEKLRKEIERLKK